VSVVCWGFIVESDGDGDGDGDGDRCVLTREANWLVFKPLTYRKIFV
jgi:hypothetical protein